MIDRLEESNGFTILRNAPASWNQINRALTGPTYELDWFRACIEAFQLEPFIVAVGPAERPRAIAPLTLVQGRLEAVGVRQLSEPMDFLAEDEAATVELAEALASLGLPLLLRRIPASSPTVLALRRAWRNAVLIERPMSSCPSLVLDQSWAEPEAHLTARRRSDFKRARRRAGHLEAQVLSPAPDEAAGLVEIALAIELRSWKGRNGTAILQLPGRADFFRQYCLKKAYDGSLRLGFLKIDGRYAAMQIAVERDDAYWLLKIGYDEQFARCSPGQLLTSHSIGWAATRQLASYEFLGKSEQWISLWTESQRPCTAVGVYPPRATSAFAATRDAWELVSWKVRQGRHAE